MSRILISAARELRKRSTNTEQLLWKYLRSRRFSNTKFRRQEPVGKFIVDFVSFEKKIVIEVDGGQHNQKAEVKNDQRRDRWFKEQGFVVLRFWNNEVLKNTVAVLEKIKNYCL